MRKIASSFKKWFYVIWHALLCTSYQTVDSVCKIHHLFKFCLKWVSDIYYTTRLFSEVVTLHQYNVRLNMRRSKRLGCALCRFILLLLLNFSQNNPMKSCLKNTGKVCISVSLFCFARCVWGTLSLAWILMNFLEKSLWFVFFILSFHYSRL